MTTLGRRLPIGALTTLLLVLCPLPIPAGSKPT